MDVRCERCQTEYEIEDARVSDLGTEVQCSDCGHLFTVKRPPTSTPSALPTSGEGKGDGAWKLLTTVGQTLDVGDLTLLHKWIIERRVTRADKISRDGQSWQTLGSMSELLPFFDIVDSAERARGLPQPSTPQVPLQPPVLTPTAPAVVAPRSSEQAAFAAPFAASPGDSLGALPQAADIGETEMILTKGAGSHRWIKLAVMAAVASGIAYAGIVWQKHHLRPAVIPSSSGTAPDQQTPATLPPPTIPAAAAGEGVAESDDDDEAHGPVVEPLHSTGLSHVPISLAAQGYVALGHHEYLEAVKLFRQELAQSPINGTALFGLAEAYRGAGKNQQALKTYRRYVDILPFGPDVGSARFQIRSLEAKKH
jgi:predicted Zn finger-like uncharacterized protein